MKPSRRAAIPESELRRWARVACKEGVAIRGRLAPDGSVTVEISPTVPAPASDNDDLDARLDAFGGS